MTASLTLVSHKLCPYVQRAAIVLAEKGMAFERIDIDLARKPDWFAEVSPLGKTPVLLVDGEPIFESAVICEYLDETASPRLHPQDALERARHRGWMEFGSALLNAIGAFYNAPTDEALAGQGRRTCAAGSSRSKLNWPRGRTSPASASRSSTPCSARCSATSTCSSSSRTSDSLLERPVSAPGARRWPQGTRCKGRAARTTPHCCARSCWRARARCRTDMRHDAIGRHEVPS